MLLPLLATLQTALVLQSAGPPAAAVRALAAVAAAYGPRQRHGFFFGTYNFDFWRWDSELEASTDYSKCKTSSGVQTRIAGGNIANPRMFPFQVGLLLLQAPNVIQCGGVLLTQRHVLTAAHCLYRSTLGKVFLGTNVFADSESAAIVYNVTRKDFLIHEGFFPLGPVLDDIAVIHLATAAPLSAAVQTIALAPSYMTQAFLEGEVTTASGWGRTADNQTDSDYLLYSIDAPVMGQRQCACFYLPGLVRIRNHICTDGAGGIGTCDGDSGGPLTYFHRGGTYLVGLTAFGSAGGCEIEFPSVYTRITSYLGWISKNTGIQVT